MFARWVCLSVLGLLLAACGGGGNGDSQASQSTPIPPSTDASPSPGGDEILTPAPGPLTDVRFTHPGDIAADASGNLYVADGPSGQRSIRRIATDGTVTTLVEYSDKYIRHISVTPDGEVFYGTAEASASHPSGTAFAIWRLSNGVPVPVVPDGIGNINEMTVDPDNGNIYFADGRQVKRAHPDGSVDTLFEFDMGYAGAMAVHNGTLWIGRHDSPRSGELFRLGADEQPELMRSEPDLISSMVSTDAGLYIARVAYVIANDPIRGCTLSLLNPDTLETTQVAGGVGDACGYQDGMGQAARFSANSRIAQATDGNLYVADSENHVIRRVTPDGEVSLFAGMPGQAGAN